MTDVSFLDSAIFTYAILPFLIFVARVLDVSIGTIRIIFIAREKRVLAPLLGFFEILIWLLAIGQIFKNMNNVVCFLAYAGGFSMGNFVGIYIEGKLALGHQVIRIVTRENAKELIHRLKEAGFGITVVNGEGATGPVRIIFTLIKRKQLQKVVNMIYQHNPKAFYSIEDVRLAHKGVFPDFQYDTRKIYWRRLLRMYKKEK